MSKLNRVAQKLDTRIIGAVFGTVFPILTVLFIWQWKFSMYNFDWVLRMIRNAGSGQTSFIIFPMLPNMILFYFSNFRLKLNRFTEGMVIVTVILTVLIAFIILL